MKNLRNTVLFLITLTVLISCKEDKSNSEDPIVTQEVLEEPIKVVLDMVVQKDDSFDLFYVEDASENFGPNRIRVDVKGKPESQQIVFNVPGNATLANLRIDMGDNRDQAELTIKNLVIKNKEKELVISPEDFFKKFSTTDNIQLTTAKFSFKTKEVNGVYDPLFYGNYSLIDTLGQFNI